MRFISIGPTCYTAFLLKENGCRTDAYPFDWVFSSLAVVEHCIRDRFADFLNVSHLHDISGSSARHAVFDPMIDTPNLRAHWIEHGEDPATQWKFFNHHNLPDCETHSAFQRRCERFLEAIQGPGPAQGKENVTLVYFNRNTDDSAEIISFAQRVALPHHVHIVALIEKNHGVSNDPPRITHSSQHLTIFQITEANSILRWLATL